MKAKITLIKDNKTIHVNDYAAKLLKKSGWIETSASPEIIREKRVITIPPEVQEVITLKKEVVAANPEPEPEPEPLPKVIAAKKPAVKKVNPNLKPAVKKQ